MLILTADSKFDLNQGMSKGFDTLQDLSDMLDKKFDEFFFCLKLRYFSVYYLFLIRKCCY